MLRRSHVFVGGTLALLAVGGWFLGRGGARDRAALPLVVSNGPVSETSEVADLRDPGRPLPESTFADEPREPRHVQAERASRRSTAPSPGPARITGRLLLPPGETLPAGLELDDVELDWRVPSSRRSESRPGPEGTTSETWDGDRCFVYPDANGVFEYSHAQTGVELELRIDARVPIQVMAIAPLAPGERRHLDIELDLGATILGVVRDDKGRSLANASLDLERVAVDGGPATNVESEKARTDDEGRFEFRNLERGIWRPTLLKYALLEPPAIDARLGALHEVVLVAERGGVLEGRVTWSDGTPVDQFSVALGGIDRPFTAGRFSLEQLWEPSYPIEVRGHRKDTFGRFSGHVETDCPELAIVLRDEPVQPVRVSVVDEHGRGLACAVRAESLGAWLSTTEALVDGDDDSLSLQLPRGRWLVSASAPGRMRDHRGIDVVETGVAVHLVLPRLASVEGRVVDPDGRPVAGASVSSGGESVVTDAEGGFSVVSDYPSQSLVAKAEGFSDSDALEVELEPGSVLSGVVLRLHPACQLSGSVLDGSGPVRGVYIEVWWGASHWSPGAETDAAGRFVCEDLRSGVTEVIAKDARTGRRVTAPVVLAPDRPAEVNLRFAPMDPVLLTVRLTRSGKPVYGGIAVRSDSYAVENYMHHLGTLWLEVPEPGRCTLWAYQFRTSGYEDNELHSIELDIPDAAESFLDLDLDQMPRATSQGVLEELDW